MTISERHIQDRIQWIKEDSQEIRTSDVRVNIFDTKQKASRLSQALAGQVPFLKAQVTAEKIIFIDFAVKSEYIDRLYIAQPLFTGITGTGCKDYPVQIACTTDYILPNTVATSREKRRKILFVSKVGAEDIFIKQIFKDEALTHIPWTYRHIINSKESMSLKVGMQVLPPHEIFKNKTFCTLSSGTIRKTLRQYGRRVYNFQNYFEWLENIIRNLKELNYTGPVKDRGVYDDIYFLFNEDLADLRQLDKSSDQLARDKSIEYTDQYPEKESRISKKTKSGKPTAAGVLLIVSGILGFFGAFLLESLKTTEEIYSYYELISVCSIIAYVFSIFVILGGLVSIKRIHWGFALICSILGLTNLWLFFMPTVLSLIALILIAMSRNEFT